LKLDTKTTQTWTSGTTHTVTDAKVTARSFILLMDLAVPTGHIAVTTVTAGSFIVESSDDETGHTFKYLIF